MGIGLRVRFAPGDLLIEVELLKPGEVMLTAPAPACASVCTAVTFFPTPVPALCVNGVMGCFQVLLAVEDQTSLLPEEEKAPVEAAVTDSDNAEGGDQA